MKRPLPVLDPARVRTPPRSFAWLDHRLRPRLADLTLEELALHVFLVLAADAEGLSCWRIDRAARMLGSVDEGALFAARDRLLELGLIAFGPWTHHDVNGVYQVLPLQGVPIAAK